MDQKEPDKKVNGKRAVLFIAAVCLLTVAVCAAYGLIRKKRGGYLGEGGEAQTESTAGKENQETKDSASAAGEDQGEPEFGSFLAYDLELNEVTQEVLKDYDLTMVNIWATFCGPCLREMPELGEIHDEYADKGVQIIGIVTDILAADGTLDPDQLDLTNEIIKKTGADYLHLVPTYDLYNLKLKDVSAVPETFFLDKDGNIVGDSYLGAKEKDDWTKIIDKLLEEVQQD